MCSTHNEGKSVVAERFMRTFKNKIDRHMTAVSKNVHIYNSDDEYNNTYHRTIRMKPVDIKSGNYIEYHVNSNNKDPKLQVGDNVRISNCKNIFGKGYSPNWSEEASVIKEVKNTVPWAYAISDLNGENIIRTFYEK